MIEKNRVEFAAFAEVGCGAGKILRELAAAYPDVLFHGYDISQQAIDIAHQFKRKNLHYFNEDILLHKHADYDVVALIDVIEHVEEYFLFLRRIRELAETFIFVIPLEISVSSVLRNVIKDSRESVGHLHYFMKDTAIATVLDTGYEIIDYCYTEAALEIMRELRQKIAWLPRKILYSINKDFCVRLLGGFPLLILAKRGK